MFLEPVKGSPIGGLITILLVYFSVGNRVQIPSKSLCLFGVTLNLYLSGTSPKDSRISTLLQPLNGYVRGRSGWE